MLLGPDLAVPGRHQQLLPQGAAVGQQAPAGELAAPGEDPPEPSGVAEATWLQPYPDILVEGLPDAAPGPEARYEAAEAISLAFVTALQALPPRQRAALILRDVVGFPTSQVAGILDSSEDSRGQLLAGQASCKISGQLGARRTPPGSE